MDRRRAGETGVLSQITYVMNSPMTANEVSAGASNRKPGLLARVLQRIRSWFEVPFGYQDGAGFHYGREPRPQKSVSGAPLPKLTDRRHEAMQHPVSIPVSEAAESEELPQEVRITAK